MSQEINYFKLGEVVFYRERPYLVKTLTTINECGILYQLVAVNSAERAFKNCMVEHVDKDLLSREEYLTKENELREYKFRHENAERMWELVCNLKNVPDVEKDRLLVSIHANCLNTRNPYLDIFNANNISPEFERHLSDLRKDLYKSLGLDKILKDDIYQGGVHWAKFPKNGFIAKRCLNSFYGKDSIDKYNPLESVVKAQWPKFDEFESPLMKELRKYVGEDLKAAKEAAEMAAEEKKNKMSITVNEEERVVTVVFEDGSVRMSRCSKDDHFDPVIGVAMCIAARKLGSRTKLKKYVESNARFVKPKKKKVDTKDETSGK